MSDERILYKFLNYELSDEHPAIYIYCVGQKRSEKTAIDNVVKIVSELFCPPYTVEFIIKVVTNFLDYKKTEYNEGKLNVVPIYQ
jgi:DNA-dependent RNA polymerase auxiliary subunit epsilon